jgi:glycosyltransferase involved in cell wall biosynthesis
MTGSALTAMLVVPSARVSGGGDVWLDALLAGLGRHGVAVVAAFEEDGELVRRATEYGCTALVLPGNGDNAKRHPRQLVSPVADVMAEYRPRVTVFWSPRAQVYGALAHQQAGRPGRTAWVQHVIPSRFWLHQAASGSPSDLVICVSRAVQARQEHLYPGPATAVVHPGVDAPERPLPRRAARHALGISGEGPAVGVVGRIEPWKGQDIAVRMLARLTSTTCSLILIGDRHSASWPGFTPEVDVLAAELGVADRVVFTGHRHDAARLLHGLDVLVCASREEGFGLAVLEAAAAGVPVVATRCGGPEDMLDHEVTGLLVPPEDPAALAEAVEAIFASPTAAARMTGNAQQLYWQRLTAAHGTARFAEALHGLAEERTGHRG